MGMGGCQNCVLPPPPLPVLLAPFPGIEASASQPCGGRTASLVCCWAVSWKVQPQWFSAYGWKGGHKMRHVVLWEWLSQWALFPSTISNFGCVFGCVFVCVCLCKGKGTENLIPCLLLPTLRSWLPPFSRKQHSWGLTLASTSAQNQGCITFSGLCLDRFWEDKNIWILALLLLASLMVATIIWLIGPDSSIV